MTAREIPWSEAFTRRFMRDLKTLMLSAPSGDAMLARVCRALQDLRWVEEAVVVRFDESGGYLRVVTPYRSEEPADGRLPFSGGIRPHLSRVILEFDQTDPVEHFPEIAEAPLGDGGQRMTLTRLDHAGRLFGTLALTHPHRAVLGAAVLSFLALVAADVADLLDREERDAFRVLGVGADPQRRE